MRQIPDGETEGGDRTGARAQSAASPLVPLVMGEPALKLGHKVRASSSYKAHWVSSPPTYSLQAESWEQGWGVRVWPSPGQRMAPVGWCFQRDMNR